MAGGQSLTVKSDPTWRAIAADWLTTVDDPRNKKPQHVPTFDAAFEPPGWRLADFNDAQWPTCRPAGDFWKVLVPSEIPPLMEARYPIRSIERVSGGVKAPADAFEGGHGINVTSDGSFSIVFDRVLSAYPTFKVRGGKGARLRAKSTRECAMILGDGEQYFECPFMDEVATLTVEVSNVTSPLEIEDAGANFTSQPVEYKGAFACSDDKLSRIWDVSRWAVQINLQTHHLDSPNHQEPISDPGDYLIESAVNYDAFAQPWLARQDLRKFAWLLKDEKYHNFHTSYSLAWLQMLTDYWDATGDEALVRELSPNVRDLLDTYTGWIGKNGIVSEAPNYMFMDWVKIGGFECHHPPAVIGQGYLTAFFYHGLEQGQRIAATMGDDARAEKYGKIRTELAAAFNRELWSPDKGLYRDGKPFQTSIKPYNWLSADKEIETFSPHVNLLAVLYDLAPREKQPEIIEKVLAENPLNTQPWFMHWALSSIAHARVPTRSAHDLLLPLPLPVRRERVGVRVWVEKRPACRKSAPSRRAITLSPDDAVPRP